MPLKNGGLTLIPTRVTMNFNSKSLDFQSEHRALIPLVAQIWCPRGGVNWVFKKFKAIYVLSSFKVKSDSALIIVQRKQ